MKTPYRIALVLTMALVVAALAAVLLQRAPALAPLPVASAPPPAPKVPLVAERLVERPAAASVPSTMQAAADQPQLTVAGIGGALEALFGRKAVLTLLQVDDFPRRFVATVDNLGRERASPMLWPVTPAAGRFTVLQQGGAPVLSPDNGLRYTPLVLMFESVSADSAVDFYARMYPLLQQAYEELGYPNRSFNDRLLEVIDLLLATPQPVAPVRLELLEIKGPLRSERPWVHFQFADPALEALAAGQKMLLRSGPVNERRLKGRLLDIRKRIVERSSLR